MVKVLGMLKIWFVDDMKSNQEMWLNSFSPALRKNHAFRTFSTLAQLFAAAQKELPDILFIDYYIGEDFGHEVVSFFLETQPRPFLVAHSSAFAANQAMVRQGADLMLEKKPGKPVTESIVRAVTSEADLYRWVDALKA